MMIEKRSLADRVAEAIKQKITEGTYEPGDKLPAEPELMKAFGVGRSSVRKAVKLLATVGGVRVRQGAGTFVAEPSGSGDAGVRMGAADRAELEEVRKMLDIAVVEKAVA